MEDTANTVTLGDSKNVAESDVACPQCGGTKPTCCSCPEPKQFSLAELTREFTQAAISAHLGFKHETRWHDCDYASCAKWREMIDTLNVAAEPELGSPAFTICACRAHGFDQPSRAFRDERNVVHTPAACR